MAEPNPIPALLPADPRVRVLGRGTGERAATEAEYVLFWPQIARRAQSNAALSYAIAAANKRGLPVLVVESLRVDYPYASDRLHLFALEGARDAAAAYEARGCSYAFFLPRSRDEQRGMVKKLCERAAALVTDDFPTFVVPAHLAKLATVIACPLIAFDDNCVVPLSAFPKEEYAARTIRPKIHRILGDWLRPIEEPEATKQAPSLVGSLPFDPFPLATANLDEVVAGLPLDHTVGRAQGAIGGRREVDKLVNRFLKRKLLAYPDDHNHPDRDATSHLSPYLHFGQISARELALRVKQSGEGTEGARDAFLEQLLVRRTLAFNLAAQNPAHTTFAAVPAWCKKTLDEHRDDPRPLLLSREKLERAESPDELWNAAQRELVATGAIHNYVRMLWGKGVIAWKKTPEEAFDDLVYLNDKYALDGRDPNTYTNIHWCFGKHDRPWGPARPILGTVRYMSTTNARKKLDLEGYLQRWAPSRQGTLL
jgi:deoxyribodipyrimidine photo-lyase